MFAALVTTTMLLAFELSRTSTGRRADGTAAVTRQVGKGGAASGEV